MSRSNIESADFLPFALKAQRKSAQGQRSATLGIPTEKAAPWKGAGRMARANFPVPLQGTAYFLFVTQGDAALCPGLVYRALSGRKNHFLSLSSQFVNPL
jgi:hypothetical protein